MSLDPWERPERALARRASISAGAPGAVLADGRTATIAHEACLVVTRPGAERGASDHVAMMPVAGAW